MRRGKGIFRCARAEETAKRGARRGESRFDFGGGKAEGVKRSETIISPVGDLHRRRGRKGKGKLPIEYLTI